jgi:hypothetical protein
MQKELRFWMAVIFKYIWCVSDRDPSKGFIGNSKESYAGISCRNLSRYRHNPKIPITIRK